MYTALIIKPNKPFSKKVILLCKKTFPKLDIFFSTNKKKIPQKLKNKKYDLIISYLSTWVIPENILKKTKRFNINFHPGPPKYPGIGCFNYAIYNKDKTYSCTAHLMQKKVDSGKIIEISKFKISKNESIKTLSLKTYKKMFFLFKRVIKKIKGNNISFKKIKWAKSTYKRIHLDNLSTIRIKVNNKEMDRFIRSTYFSGYSFPRVKINNHTFIYKKNAR
tara:strand:- start:229 stop:888 length:660 start_codon:yes stop_codon:yes gene_type:complete